MTDDEKKIRLGIVGEHIVGNYYANGGHKVIYPTDPFDNGKDLLINDLKVEIKTMVPLVNDDCFDLPLTQLDKVKTCDQLIFVSVPFPNGKLTHYSCGSVYAAKLNKAYFTGDFESN